MQRITHTGEPFQTSTDGPGRCVITWLHADGTASDTQCDGWIEAGRVFAPADGAYCRAENFTDTGEPDQLGGWYALDTGEAAILGVPGATLATPDWASFLRSH